MLRGLAEEGTVKGDGAGRGRPRTWNLLARTSGRQREVVRTSSSRKRLCSAAARSSRLCAARSAAEISLSASTRLLACTTLSCRRATVRSRLMSARARGCRKHLPGAGTDWDRRVTGRSTRSAYAASVGDSASVPAATVATAADGAAPSSFAPTPMSAPQPAMSRTSTMPTAIFMVVFKVVLS